MTQNESSQPPDQIMAWNSQPWYGTWSTTRYPDDAVPYVPLALVAAEREANAGIADEWCRRMEETGLNHPEDSDSRDRCFARACQAMYIAEATRARTDADAQAALEARDKRVREEALREALPVTSALAAAISLLDRARLQAPSDKMFEQMVLDYQRALDDFRAALQTDTDKP